MSADATLQPDVLPVHSDPEVLGGVPVFAGTRVPAHTLFDYLADGNSLDEYLDNFPSVSREQAIRLLEHAADSLPRCQPGRVMERWGKIGEEMDRSFDTEFWQSQEPSARMAAAWDLVVTAYEIKGQDANALRLDRNIESFQLLQS
jgi:uncharacterized protein (DUF433 family)